MTTVRMSIDEDPLIVRLATSLGYLRDEGIEIVPVDLEKKMMGEDWLMEQPLTEGRIDAAYHWFNHTVFGARHGYVAFERQFGYAQLENKFASGSYDEPAGTTPGLMFIVNKKKNLLAGLTLGQIDGIYGAQRTAGWVDGRWSTVVARGPGKNIRTWGQLGLKGAWADQPIGPSLLGAGSVTFFQSKVLNGSAMWNEDLREYQDRKQMIADLSRDPYGIAYGDYALPRDAGKLAVDTNLSSGLDNSVERQWRATGDKSKVHAEQLYENRFVEYAMGTIK